MSWLYYYSRLAIIVGRVEIIIIYIKSDEGTAKNHN
jgi:hypothetical protein